MTIDPELVQSEVKNYIMPDNGYDEIVIPTEGSSVLMSVLRVDNNIRPLYETTVLDSDGEKVEASVLAKINIRHNENDSPTSYYLIHSPDIGATNPQTKEEYPYLLVDQAFIDGVVTGASASALTRSHTKAARPDELIKVGGPIDDGRFATAEDTKFGFGFSLSRLGDLNVGTSAIGEMSQITVEVPRNNAEADGFMKTYRERRLSGTFDSTVQLQAREAAGQTLVDSFGAFGGVLDRSAFESDVIIEAERVLMADALIRIEEEVGIRRGNQDEVKGALDRIIKEEWNVIAPEAARKLISPARFLGRLVASATFISAGNYGSHKNVADHMDHHLGNYKVMLSEKDGFDHEMSLEESLSQAMSDYWEVFNIEMVTARNDNGSDTYISYPRP